MTIKQDLHSAYVLHTRAYRETSMLVEILSAEHGRVALVARGAKRGKSKLSTILQPFLPVQVSWFGNGELVTLMNVEATQPGPSLYGRNAICGLYLNELLVKLLPKWDNCSRLYAAYEQALFDLKQAEILDQVVLRRFEIQLLKSLGYGLQLQKEITTGANLCPECSYIFDPEQGPRLASPTNTAAMKGSSFLAMANEDWQDPKVLLDLKLLMRIVLRHHLGNKQLMSRELI